MTTGETHTFTATLWRWAARDDEKGGAWFFVTLPHDVSDAVEDQSAPGPGFGSVRVEVTVGATTWQTSVFPSKEQEAYVLPIKKPVRTAEGIVEDGDCQVRLRVV